MTLSGACNKAWVGAYLGEKMELAGIQTEATPDQSESVAPANVRIASLDFIRGIAVMGILAANIVAFGQPSAAYVWPDAFLVSHGETEDWMWVTQLVLVDGKMRGLFTLLFGAGMLLFLDKAWASGQTRWLQVRRLLWLGLFGLCHYFFIWFGDILFGYASLGLIALLFTRLAPHKLLVLGLIGYVIGALAFTAMMGMPQMVAETSLGESSAMEETIANLDTQKASELAKSTVAGEMIAEGRYGDWVGNQFEHASNVLIMPMMFSLETIPLMLIGMACYRYGLFEGRTDRRKTLRWGWIGVILGGGLTLLVALWAKAGGLTYWGTIAAMMGWSALPRLFVVMGLAALLALWGLSAKGWLAERVSAAGRSAFSNYLGTSVLMLFVFHGWALGLFGKLGRGELYLVVLATWAIMLLWSKPWLDRFRYGPLEWLWRCLTYWKLFPLRR